MDLFLLVCLFFVKGLEDDDALSRQCFVVESDSDFMSSGSLSHFAKMDENAEKNE
jgi:hypothetical protein